MTKINLLTFSLIAMLILNLGIVGYLFFQKPVVLDQTHPPFGHEGPKNEIIRMLHFDNEQIQQYKLTIDKHRATIRQLNENIELTKSALYYTLQKEADPQKDSLLNQLAFLQKEIEQTHYAHFVEIKKLCKPNQLDDYNELTSQLARFFEREKHYRMPPGQ